MGKYIISDPDILGGTPVIKGTRVPIGPALSTCVWRLPRPDSMRSQRKTA